MDGADRTEGEQAGASAPPERDAAETEIRTFLIADIRGYTTFTREHGDEAAAELAARFAAQVREVVTARGGFLLELRGDEALVVFLSARQALRAAIELQTRFVEAELPRGVGIGLDAGEAVPVEGGYRGSALNVAARLCAQAGPGEIIASEAVIHLAARVEGLAYVEPRSYRLKGLADPIRAVGVVPEGLVPRGFRHTLRRARRILPFERRSQIVGVGVVAALAVAGVAVWAATGAGRTSPDGSAQGSQSPGVADDPLAGETLPALAFVDAATGEIVDTVAVRNVVEAQFIDGHFWVLGLNPKALYQIDPETHQIVNTITIPLAKEGYFTIDQGTLWFTDFGEPGRVIGIDISTQVIVHDFRFNDDPEDLAKASGVAVGAGSLWISMPEAGEILRLDPTTGEVQARIEMFIPDVLEFGEDALWVTGAGRIARVDPATNRLSFEPKELAFDRFLAQIEFSGGHAWTADEEQGIVWKVDRNGRVAGTYETGAGARPLAFADGMMWVGNQDAGTISAIDVVTGAITNHEVGHSITAIAAGEGQVLVGVWPSVEEYLATLEGQMLKIGMPGDPFFGLAPDPPANFTFEVRQVEYATCASLLAYPDEPAPVGWELRPEVAEALPQVSADGRTYTFQIREGFAFSPPSDEPVTAETFQYSMERALAPELGRSSGDLGMRYLGDILGAGAFHEGSADHVEGLEVEGTTLTITLEEPSPNLPQRLALPYFCPVPIGTPIAIDGLDPDPPLASAGPYYLYRHLGGELAELRPNPNYPGTRPQNYDHIVLRLGLDAPDAVALVQAGELDAAITGPFRSLLSPQGDLALQWGPTSEAAANGDQRWFGGPRFGLNFIAINPDSALFSDVAIRQAVSLAVDRTAIASAFSEAPAAGMLPPSVPGSPAVDARVPEPDVEAALALMAGRTGRAVMVVPGECTECVDSANSLAGNLAPIGIEVEVRAVDGDPIEALTAPDADVDLFYGFLDTDFPDPAALLGSMRRIPWVPDPILAELDRVEALGGQKRVDAAVALAHRLSEEDFLAIPIAYPVFPMFIGETVGCAFVQPAIGAVDLAALCPD